MSKFTQGIWKACIDGSVDIENDRGRVIGTICYILRFVNKNKCPLYNVLYVHQSWRVCIVMCIYTWNVKMSNTRKNFKGGKNNEL